MAECEATPDTGGQESPRSEVELDPFRSLRVRDLALKLVIALVALVPLAVVAVTRHDGKLGPWEDSLSMFFVYAVLLLQLYVWCRRHHADWRGALGGPPAVQRQWWLLLLVAPLLMTDLTSATIYYNFFPDDPATPDSPDGLGDQVVSILCGPVVEEIVFRGIIFRRLATKWGLWPGILASSILFGAAHEQDQLGGIMFGIVVCIIYLKTRSLLLPILVHCAYNLLATLPSVFSSSVPDAAGSSTPAMDTGTLAVLAALAILGAGALVWWIRRLRPLGTVDDLWRDKTQIGLPKE
jgi:membrane protease YdiL (CAAX protease family)